MSVDQDLTRKVSDPEKIQFEYRPLSSIEICAGAGGQAIGIEQAGFEHRLLVEIDPHACETLRANRPTWTVLQEDLKKFARNAGAYEVEGTDLVAGGVPCPPFSVAGLRLGEADERDLFPAALEVIEKLHPRAVMLENVRGLLDPRFTSYRGSILRRLHRLGYRAEWRLLYASDFGLPQLRPRAICVALKPEYWGSFYWPIADSKTPGQVGDLLFDLMSAHGWQGAPGWRKKASGIAPTIVGGSHKHGGPDLGPTRARHQWAQLGVDGLGIADDSPRFDFPPDSKPRLTLRMVARLQGFPDDWTFVGGKTAAYRQIGNALPPPMGRAVARAISRALSGLAVGQTRQLELAEMPL